MKTSVAIVGMACEYPDAAAPAELWSNALAGRRAFRRMPSVRMNADDYLADDRAAPDSTYVLEAAVIEDYQFDRVRFRVAGNTFRSADHAHWLALDVASRALVDAGFPDGEGLPKEVTGVLLGNTLTGEFSRANLMRLRWPYVRRVLEQELIDGGWSAESRALFLARLEERYKAPFPPVGEESLAGGLSNTIAGRICNYFDLKGGGFTIDGACASSLLAVATACSSLAAGDLDVALAGGVDLSLDPFEVIGFAKTGALAPEKMRVYDARSAGFWPGEGCGFVVLMRHEDAVERGMRIYATIRGWGISSDGSGGITRPEVDGQILALQRAYRRAGFGVESVSYFEGHGTGTNVGDATELQTISRARREADPSAAAAVIGSVKAIIGHTKAAAGVAGLIKATMALHSQVLPPTVGCETPHPVIDGENPALRVLERGMLWPAGSPLRAGVSAMGFGGINTHLVLEGADGERRRSLSSYEETLLRSQQDVELILLGDRGRMGLLEQVERLLRLARGLSRAELIDLADRMQHDLASAKVRAAVIVSSPGDLADRLAWLAEWLREGITDRLDATRGIFLGSRTVPPRLGFLFPGQGSPAHLDGGMMRRRFEAVRELYDRAGLPADGDGVSTDVAQPAIVTASMAALRLLDRFGITAEVGLGHSLGELSALHWGGAFDEDALLRIARVRGRAMADLGAPTGAMASITAPAPELEMLIGDDPVVIAGLNSPRQTVISGERAAVEGVIARARAAGLHATLLPVSHAFHSPLVAAAAEPLLAALRDEPLARLRGGVVSTVTGLRLAPEADLRDLLYRQITEPVRFIDAIQVASRNIDLFIEVGPGTVLAGLAGSVVDVPVISLDAGCSSLKGFFGAVAAAYVLGAPVHHRELFADRFARPIDLGRPRRFFENPCEHAPLIDGNAAATGIANGHASLQNAAPLIPLPVPAPAVPVEAGPETGSEAVVPSDAGGDVPVLDIVRRHVALRAELPPEAVKDGDRLLSDLHLNSITISQLVVEIARELGLQIPFAPTEFANATVGEVAVALDALRATAGEAPVARDDVPAGVDSWVRAFVPVLKEMPGPARTPLGEPGAWQVLAPDGHPLAEALRGAIAAAGGRGIAVCLPEHAGEESIDLLLKGAGLAGRTGTFLLVGHDGAPAFARTLALERPSLAVLVIDIPFDHPDAVKLIVEEARAASGFAEVYYDRDGARRSPVWELLPSGPQDRPLPLTGEDLLLVTGGGKGIAAESALELARETGAWLLLMGRSAPERDEELSANLKRFTDAGATFRYVRADVADAAGVREAIRQGERELGRTVTAFLHGAGYNFPQLIDALDRAAFRKTLAPKLHGMRNVLDALDPERLRLLVAFGSIIGRAGLPGEADYALSNEWLSRLTEEWGREHPHCRCMSIEWSIWSGVGMGERLGRVEALMREGIQPVTPEAGLAILKKLLAHDTDAVSIVVAARFGSLPTVRLPECDLPLLRFIEQPRVHYPGLELVADACLTVATDPYLAEHTFHGERLFPAVMGLEAFAQAAATLAGAEPSAITFRNVRFERPVVVPEGSERTIRIAALRREDGTIDVALRSSETGFQADHFTAVCAIGGEPVEDAGVELPGERLPLDADAEMYRGILFQRGRFRRVTGYRRLRAKEGIAEVRTADPSGWFSQYLPGRLLLGDAGARDAAIHSIQGCIPHMTLLPVAVEAIAIISHPITESVFIHATEKWHEGALYLYDCEIRDAEGRLHERWDGLLLRAVEKNRHQGAWHPVLLGPYIERRLEELVPGARLSVAVGQTGALERTERSNGVMLEAIGAPASISRRGDGKPGTGGPVNVSAAHAGDLTLAVACTGHAGCDLEDVAPRDPTLWSDLLGDERFRLAELIMLEAEEELDASATRIWAAAECLKKAGALVGTPLTLKSAGADGWVLLMAGSSVIGTYLNRSADGAKVLAMIVGEEHRKGDGAANGHHRNGGVKRSGANGHALDAVATATGDGDLH